MYFILMKNAGIIGNLLMGIFVIAQLFETNKTPETSMLFLVIFLGLAYNALAYEIKFVKDHKFSYGHMAIALIYLINTFWCPVLEPKLALSLMIVSYHLFLTKKSYSFNMFGYLLGVIVYLYEGYEVIKENDKTFITWIKLLACILFVVYYISHLKEEHNEDKKH